MTDPPSDRALVDRVIAERDEGAFRALYRRHTPYLFQLVLRLQAGSAADAEDVVQETWIRAATAFGRFRWDSTLRTWLGSIAINVTRDWLRRRGRRETVELRPDLHAAPPTSVPERVDLERAIAELPDGCRTVLVLHDIEGFTHVEIGRRLGIEPVSSRTQLCRARRALRSVLAGAAPAAPMRATRETPEG